jgi:hypothetical protein
MIPVFMMPDMATLIPGKVKAKYSKAFFHSCLEDENAPDVCDGHHAWQP